MTSSSDSKYRVAHLRERLAAERERRAAGSNLSPGDDPLEREVFKVAQIIGEWARRRSRPR